MFPKWSKRYMHSLKRVFVNNNIPCFAKVHALLCAHLLISQKWEETAGSGDRRMNPQRPPRWWWRAGDLEPCPGQELALKLGFPREIILTDTDLRKSFSAPCFPLSIRAALSRNSNNDICLLHLPEGHWRTIAKYIS